jgi:uncharacterized protein (TIGR01777 family)
VTTAPIILAGGSGFIGRSLQHHFAALGRPTVVLTRDASRVSGPGRHIAWDGERVGPWWEQLEGAAAVVNLAGRSVDCRYNAANGAEILASRVRSVAAIAEAMARCTCPPPVWVQSATTAIYGEAGDAVLDESAPLNTGFSPSVAKAWEAAFADAQTPGVRKVLLRISFVLGPGGGALRRLGALARWGMGGTVGSGRQWVSWIDHHDLSRLVAWAIDTPSVQGLYHATSPGPVRNAEFMRAIRRAVRRPWSPPAPAWAVRLGCVVMRTESELALKGRRCLPARAMREGFRFEPTNLGASLIGALRDGGTTATEARGAGEGTGSAVRVGRGVMSP